MENSIDNQALETLVEVFHCDTPQEMALIKTKLEAAGLQPTVDNSYLGFLATPTSTALKIKVALKNEAEALKIIDEYLQNNGN